jgi:hypothetical protein
MKIPYAGFDADHKQATVIRSIKNASRAPVL